MNEFTQNTNEWGNTVNTVIYFRVPLSQKISCLPERLAATHEGLHYKKLSIV